MATPISRAEGSFRRPEGFRDYLQAEATGRATFLSNMDQFYAQLEESVRQFDETLGYKEDVLTEETRMFDVGEERATSEFASSLSLRKSELDILRDSAMSEATYRTGQLGLGERRLDLEEKELGRSSGGQSLVFDMSAPSKREIFDYTRKLNAATLAAKAGPKSGAIHGDIWNPGFENLTSEGVTPLRSGRVNTGGIGQPRRVNPFAGMGNQGDDDLRKIYENAPPYY